MLFGKKRDKETKAVQKGQTSSRGTTTGASQSWDAGPTTADAYEEAAPTPDAQSDARSRDQVSEAGYSLLLTISSIDQLEQSSGQGATGAFEGGWLQLSAGDGGRAVQSFPASEGDLFAAQATIVLLDPGQNDIPSRFFFGPIFFDADGKVLLWWKPFNKPDAESTDVTVEARAPEGTAAVKLGIHGSWDASGNAGDYVVGFANARLLKRTA